MSEVFELLRNAVRERRSEMEREAERLEECRRETEAMEHVVEAMRKDAERIECLEQDVNDLECRLTMSQTGYERMRRERDALKEENGRLRTKLTEMGKMANRVVKVTNNFNMGSNPIVNQY